MFLSKGLK
jgi:hypothetical protein